MSDPASEVAMGGFSHEYEHRGDPEWLKPDAADQEDEASADDRQAREALVAAIGRSFHMRVLREIAHLAHNYPELPLVLTENRIAIPCTFPGGFAMSIETQRGRYIVRLGDWRDEFALAGEAVELLESALRGEIRIRMDIHPRQNLCSAERRLPTGEWITLPHFEDDGLAHERSQAVRTVYLRNGPILD